jgi:predicted nucleic acid-binding protein
MTDAAFVLVDSNIIIDIVRDDPVWVDWSVDTLSQFEDARINPIIYAELCYQQTSPEEVDKMLETIELGYSELPREALFLASQAFRKYREIGGTKTSPLADFFIGAHAAALGIPLITRDPTRYRNYFPMITLITP